MSEAAAANVELLMITPNAERLIESCGRTCYESYDKVTEDSHKKLIRHLIKSGHTSVFEHACVTFRITNVSRSFSHQLVRHRMASPSQKSQRYVKENDFEYVLPPSIEANPKAMAKYELGMMYIDSLYNDLVAEGIRKEDARYVLPNACTTTIDMTFNFRSLFNVFHLRGDKHAQWEIRKVAMDMLTLVKEHAPTVFESYENDLENNTIIRVELCSHGEKLNAFCDSCGRTHSA